MVGQFLPCKIFSVARICRNFYRNIPLAGIFFFFNIYVIPYLLTRANKDLEIKKIIKIRTVQKMVLQYKRDKNGRSGE